MPFVKPMQAAFLMLVLMAISGCSPGYGLPPLQSYDGETYRLGVGDQVRLITAGVEQLSGTFRVDDAGNLEVPLLGSFRAEGLTPREFRTALQAELEKQKLLTEPRISVEVLEYRPIYVLGEVNKPGPYPYRPGMRALTAVAVAGGFTYRAVRSHVEALRSVGSEALNGRLDIDAFVAPGDVVTVLERYF
jgi:polysaccharide export outer membrane protein